MLVLGIETSCDETAVALVEDSGKVISSQVASQTDVHSTFGGIVPEIAAREHLRLIDPLFQELLVQTGIRPEKIDAIAVTQGPGLIGALLVGISYAKGLALGLGRPLVPVDHVEAHIYSAFLSTAAVRQIGKIEFPAIALVVSGGHTNLYHMAQVTTYELLAHSLDDACGECFDKVGKMLGLSYPGGPQIEKLAEKGRIGQVPMPRMVTQSSKMAFSYSGLKTHVANLLAGRGGEIVPEDGEFRADLCASFQHEAFSQLVRKTSQILRKDKKIKSVIISGGVSANKYFRDLVGREINLPVFFPEISFCSDNAAMIAGLGLAKIKSTQDTSLYYSQDWDAYSRYQFAKVKR